ncbi:MAG: hypothetical protein ICV60_21020 [Pyrinomonadaceae bacterium]|nr:hypothetical protein [Pyrinomonadaceae bacterium]
MEAEEQRNPWRTLSSREVYENNQPFGNPAIPDCAPENKLTGMDRIERIKRESVLLYPDNPVHPCLNLHSKRPPPTEGLSGLLVESLTRSRAAF